MTTTPTTRPRSRRPCARRARSSRGGWWRCSSPTSTRARRCSRASSVRALALADVAVVLDVYPARERAEDFPGVSGLLLALATADAAGGRPVIWLPTFADAEPVLRGLLERGRPVPRDGRRRRRCAGAPSVRLEGADALTADRRSDAHARGEVRRTWTVPRPPPHDRAPAPSSRSATSRSRASRPCARAAPRSCSRASAARRSCWSCSRGRTPRRCPSRWSGRAPTCCRRRGRRRPGAEARGRAGGDRAGGGAGPAVRRRRAPARGGRVRRAGGPVGDRVRRQHPRHRRRRGADERQRLRRRARPDAGVGGGRHRAGGSTAARRPTWGSPTAAPPSPPARSSRAPRSRCTPRRPRRSRRRSRSCAPAATRPSRRGSRRSARPSRTRRTQARRGAPRACCSPRPAAPV